MALYTFYCWRADGASPTLETRELLSDELAMTVAPVILGDHASCQRIEVYEGDRLVGETPT